MNSARKPLAGMTDPAMIGKGEVSNQVFFFGSLAGALSGNSVLQKGHFFCLIPAMTGIFFWQFGHTTGLDNEDGLKHIISYLLYY
jgi:hypothetical protein